MGTFGTGPFSSDGALDFLDELAEQPPERRKPTLARMFVAVRDKPEVLWREFFPDEVVAAAAIVAATLPGGQRFDEQLEALVEQDLARDIRLGAPAPELADLALGALELVAGPDGPWLRGWTRDEDAAEARDTITALSQALNDSLA